MLRLSFGSHISMSDSIKIGPALLYIGAPGHISKKNERAIDIAHALSLCYYLCLLYFQGELQDPTNRRHEVESLVPCGR
ncbi:Uncharacterized protein HZ326_22687 [Fusarium oxysporum f. sp. albedinis]|nr:Uncharacterized protein HZ326_22687 [Fusarium oxysporum f. sp. albedinis]